jgi:hypothetical protein
MEQFNNILPAVQEEINPAAGTLSDGKGESLLLKKVRQKFGSFGLISLTFGGLFALLFYKSVIGLNVLLFTIGIVFLISIVIKLLSLRIKTGTKLYFVAGILLGCSSFLTANEAIQLLNIIGILLLLDMALLHQFFEGRQWDFLKHLGSLFGMVIWSIASIGYPFIDFYHFLKDTRLLKNEKVRNTVIGFAISLPMLLIILGLLSRADLLFGKLTKSIFQFTFSTDIFEIIFMIGFGFLVCYSILCGTLSRTEQPEKAIRTKVDSSIASTFMMMLCIVYLLFCGIQLIYLFANGVFVLPQEFTFAEYARRGFFELLAVTVINIVLMLVCGAFFKESRLLRILVIVMTVCTYIMIASATYRMLLYIGAYHLTLLRLFVLLALLIDAFVLAGIIISQYHRSFPLFRYCVAVISICYIAFSFSKPDYYTAAYLAGHKEKLDIVDMEYLTQELSLDAAPVVLPLLQKEDSVGFKFHIRDRLMYNAYIEDYKDKIRKANSGFDIRELNYSDYIASKCLKEYN